MRRYLLRRLLHMGPVLVITLGLNFALIHLAPGDPIVLLAGDSGDEAYYAAMRRRWGLDRPLGEQWFRYLLQVLRGELGYSFQYQQPVLSVIASRLWPTLLLTGTSLVVATGVGLWLGVQASVRAGTPIEHAIGTLTLLGGTLPTFWVGQVLVIVFAAGLGLFPIQGMVSPRAAHTGLRYALDVAHHLVLPALTLTVWQLALIVHVTRAGMREALAGEFIRTAHAKGVAPRAIWYRHALRHAVLPLLTVVGQHMGTFLAGATLTEIVFAWPGLGRLLYDATLARDYPLLLAMVLVTAVMVMIATLATDLLYALSDPRIRYA
jgi:peptide/nickel transport system permease protein